MSGVAEQEEKPYIRKMYHTQEKWANPMIHPVYCETEDAWLGYGFYFWLEIEEAHKWGKRRKTATGSYEIYQATIHTSKFLDTVFNEKHYRVWLEIIEEAIEDICKKKSINQPNLFQINEWLLLNADLKVEFEAVLFQDFSEDSKILVKRGSGEHFYYKKRIQLVAYHDSVFYDFKKINEFKCN